MIRSISEEGQKRIHAGQIIGAIKSHERKLKNEESYYTNPKLCRFCNKPIDYKSRNDRIFCSSFCSAFYNNEKRLKIQRFCLNCGSLCGENATKYCSKKCMKEYKETELIKQWLQLGKANHINGNLPQSIRRYLIKCNNNSCQKCGWGEINPRTQLIPLQIHHIDGNYKNNHIDNLQVLCPNCHSLTETYGSGNKGNGREYRYR